LAVKNCSVFESEDCHFVGLTVKPRKFRERPPTRQAATQKRRDPKVAPVKWCVVT